MCRKQCYNKNTYICTFLFRMHFELFSIFFYTASPLTPKQLASHFCFGQLHVKYVKTILRLMTVTLAREKIMNRFCGSTCLCMYIYACVYVYFISLRFFFLRKYWVVIGKFHNFRAKSLISK